MIGAPVRRAKKAGPVLKSTGPLQNSTVVVGPPSGMSNAPLVVGADANDGKRVGSTRGSLSCVVDDRHRPRPAGGTAAAQGAYPTRAVTFINPFPPGGAVDVVGRPLAAVLEPMIQQPVVIDTKAGAAGQVGAQVAANAKPDGYTLLLTLGSISGFAEVDKLFGRQPKFTRADFIGIARFIVDPLVLVVNDQQPYKTLKEFVDDAKARPNQLIFSSSGLYGALHLPTAIFMKATGIRLRHLPTAGGGPALTAVLGNNSQVLVSSIAAANSQIKAGKLKPLAVFSAERAPALPEVPTLKELGYDVDFYLWLGMFAPKGTPEPIIGFWRDMSRKAADSEQFKSAVKNLGQDVAYLDQPEFKTFWDADAARVEDAVRSIGKVD